jgi:hypothetical protein
VASFKHNPEFEKEFFREAEIKAIVDKVGEEVLRAAKDNATAHDQTGRFSGSITGKSRVSGTGRPHYTVSSDDPAVYSKEFGTSKTTAIRALGRAIRGATAS